MSQRDLVEKNSSSECVLCDGGGLDSDGLALASYRVFSKCLLDYC